MDYHTIILCAWIVVSLFVFCAGALRLAMALDDEWARQVTGWNSNRKVVAYIAIRKSLIYTTGAAAFVGLGVLLLAPLPDWDHLKDTLVAVVLLAFVTAIGVDLWLELRDRKKLRLAITAQRQPPAAEKSAA